jgi:phospholipid/cholesterol/gamma-HCH transport system ATP-binding protein
MSATPVVEVRGLVSGFGTQLVHDQLELTVNEGEIFCIVGGSGTGKSVLLRIILGLQRPRAGQILIRGRDLTQMSAAELYEAKAGYGVTFQQGALFSSLTVLQNIQLPMLEHLRLPARLLSELARFKLRLVGLEADAAEKYPAQLSGGMVKRVALARALALDPGLLFLDEPTSGLDPISAAAFDELLIYLQRELKLTVVMITHDLDSIYRVSSRVGVLVDKHLVSGTLADIAAYDHPWIRAYFQGERARSRGRPNGTGS